MPAHTFAFHLSPRGKLRWAIASLFLAVHLPNAMAGGVVVAPGPGGTAQLQTQGGVPIVNIVAPNGSGLSHNQFLDYNVDRQGLVLNNALQAGQSQLAGQLAANPQLQGQAARVILNEVISRNPSAINGAQEIFGRAADYVLANPNGISVNGGSFINTPNANLVVGRPELTDGKLQALSTRDASGQLRIQSGGLRNAEGSINLIAPRIDSQGAISARDQLNLTVGRNQVDYASGQVKTVDPAGNTADGRIDASLFGAMQAGRINIVSTAEGAGVRVGAVQVTGRDGVQIRSAGDLTVSGAAVANSLDVTRAGIRSSQGDVGLHSGKDLTLAATDVSGRDVIAEAKRNLTLTTVESRKLQEKRENWNNSTIGITWETYDRTQTDSETRQHGSQIVASRDAKLSSGKDTELKAAKVEAAKNLSVQSGGDLRLSAATESHTQTDQGNHRKHLWKADWNNSSEEQRSVTSQLKAGNIALQTAALLRSEGAEMTSTGDLQLAGKQVEITTAARTNRSSDNRYSGDLVGGGFFGKTGDADKGQTQHQGSKVNAAGKLIVKADEVRISGSQVRGGSDASVISDKGSLVIDGVQDTTHSNNHDKDSKFFGISKDESRQNSKDSTTLRSELVSDSNLKLKSAKDLEVAGSTVKAGGALTADAAGDVNVHSAQNTHDSSATTDTRGFDAYAKEQTPEQYRAGVHYEDKQQTVTSNDVTQQGSSLSGGSVQVKAGGDVTLKGTQVKSTAGDTTLSGKNVSLLAEQDSHQTSSDTSSTGGGFYYTGGLDRAGSGVDFAHSSVQDSTSKTTAQTTQVQSSGGLHIKADKLATEGAQLEAGNGLQVVANEVDNRAASNSDSSTHAESNWSADIGANVEYKDIARPIAGVVKEVLNGKVPDKDALSNLGQPNVGIDVAVGHGSATKTEQTSNAVVSRFDGGNVAVKVAGTLHDQGSEYNASAGTVNISADRLVADAASNTHSSTDNAVDAKVDVRVYTKTGEDVNVAGSGAGGSRTSSKDSSTAVVGGYAGSQGVNINTAGDAQFAGNRFDGGKGGVNIHTGGDLALNQATDRQHSSDSSDSSLRGNGSLTVGTLPGTDGTNVDLGAGFQLDHTGKQTTDTQAHVASFSGNGVQLSSGGNQTQQGTKIDSTGAIDLHADGKLDLQAASDTHTATGSNLGGGLKGGGSKTSSEKSSDQGANLSANFNIGRVNENAQTLTGGQLNAQGAIALSGDSVHLQGTQVSAPNVSIDAQKGGYVQESAQSTDNRNNWNVALNAGGNLSKSTPTAADEKASSDHGFNAGAQVAVDYQQGTSQQNSQIKADTVLLNSAGDAQLAGARIDANHVSGKVAGDLTVESRQDSQTQAKVDVDLGLTAKKTPADDKGKLAGTDYKPTLKAQGEYAHKDSVAQASGISASQGVNLAVGGATQLTGARITSSEAKVDLGASKVSSSDLNNRDYGVKAGLDLPHKTEENASKVSPENGNLKIGPVTLSGHLDSQTLQAGIDEKG